MSPFSSDSILHAQQQLHLWYAHAGRKDLPWRTTCDPYAIWVSEVMLQQTQVVTVKERFYLPFMRRFPHLMALANAPEEDVIKAWEGLGYYRRARWLHRAAQQCNGSMPTSIEGLMQLPGIGQTTAHAIASFAYNAPAPILDANVKRVLSRLFALTSPTEAQLWQAAWEWIEGDATPAIFNQAMMDVGALLCTPRQPACGQCPFHAVCRGKGNPGAYPQKTSRPRPPVRQQHWWVVKRDADSRFALWLRESQHLGGLYGVWQREEAPPITQPRHHLGSIRQLYSHYTLKAQVWITSYNCAIEAFPANPRWVSLQEARQLPTSKAEHKLFSLLEGSIPMHQAERS